MRVFRVVSVAGLAWAAAVMACAYLAIALYTSSPWLWSTIVHETGDKTLRQTILYYEHAARELPLDIVLGIAIGGSALFVLPARRRQGSRIVLPGAALTAIAVLILVGTVNKGGVEMLADNLLQRPTRPEEPLVWGGHWRYHLLSHFSLLLLSFGFAGLLLAASRRQGHSAGLRFVAVAFGLFGALTLLFVPGVESFRDPVFLGHQAREVFTHALVTIPLAWGVCLVLGRDEWNRQPPGSISRALPITSLAAGIVVSLFLAAGSLATSATSHGQSESLGVLIFPHFFEHVFSYVVATLTAALVFARGRVGP